MTKPVCESCGARLEVGDAICPLCGTPSGLATPEAGGDFEPPSNETEDLLSMQSAEREEEESPRSSPGEGGRRYCIQCGKASPPEARFCAWCGAAIPTSLPEDLTGAEPVARRSSTGKPVERSVEKHSTKTAEPKQTRLNPRPASASPKATEVDKRVVTLLAAAVTAVVGLFLVSLLMQGKSPSARPDRSGAESTNTAPSAVFALPPEIEQSARSLREQVEGAATAEAKEEALRSLVSLYASVGRFDLAAAVQEEVALDNSTAEGWAAAGNLHFDWMEATSPGQEREFAARRAVQAYSRSLELDATNNDVRTDRAVAYLNDPATAMTAIEEVNTVLESDPGHLQANFNKAVMMTMIGRSEQAIEFYRKVTELADPSSPMYLEAKRRLDELMASGG